MTYVTCRLTAKNRDQLRNPTLGNRVWASFLLPSIIVIYINSNSNNKWADISPHRISTKDADYCYTRSVVCL